MKNLYNIRLLWLFCLVLSLGAVMSCEDEEVVSETVVLESFGPSGVNHGETIKFIGLNLNKVSAIVLPGVGEIASSQFTSQSSKMIELVVPMEAVAGKVVLKTTDGEITTKTMLNFLVPVEISAITPEARPGDNITINGKLINWIESVTFNDGITVTEFVSQSMNELVVTVPMEAQTGALIFATGGTKPLSFASEEELIVTLPAVTALSPASVRHTGNLTITGTNLDLVTSIVFIDGEDNKEVSEFVSQSATEIVVAVPAGTVDGVLTLKQASPVEVETTQELKITLPVATAVTPVPAGPGVEMTITGTDLDLVKEILFPGVATAVTSFVSQTPGEIVVKAPEEAIAGGGLFFVTLHGFKTASGVKYKIPSVGGGDTPLYTVYADALHADWQKWNGWGTAVQEMANTELPKGGDNAIKITYNDAWGGFQLHPASPDPFTTDTYASLKLSIAGGTGTADGTPILVYIKTKEGAEGTKVTLNLGAPNTYKTFDIPLADFGNPANIAELVIQNGGTAGEVTFYVDEIGLY